MKCAGWKCSSGLVLVPGAMLSADVRWSAPLTLPLLRSSFKDKRFSRDLETPPKIVDFPAGICDAGKRHLTLSPSESRRGRIRQGAKRKRA
jgi:hypothetical protein